MSEITSLISALKKALKQQGKTYRDVAQLLGLSESSVKRIFTSGDLSLKRLDKLCGWLGITITGLSVAAEAQQPTLSQLTIEQEQELVVDPIMLLVASCVLNQWQFAEIISYYNITEPQCVSKLAALDRLGVIELLPGNRIKLRVAPNFRWQTNGPIQQFFQNSVEREFFNSNFAREDEQFIVLNGTLSAASSQIFQKRMRKLASEFNELSKADLALPLNERHGTTAVIAVRQWHFALFEQYRA
ncbi:helix-turn-helix transcriptional regulator [Porticoccus sp. W117]|uniref:helix-turn-helix domain-containing protein n=1 Tax=Porticoccus sp. W117 TaxID=3054777 RepID=UPI002597883B|nr:helix-turn-helix transcriptional regulator [Porticoccus sp. W117]MDM3872544.1 helix-turn-helix transcriptional regulator [Porticoccus sp. W117]